MVGAAGFEPATPRPPGHQDDARGDTAPGSPEKTDARASTTAHDGGDPGPAPGPLSDPVDAALAAALERASTAGEWSVVVTLANELQARRVARVRDDGAHVIELDAKRDRRR